MNYINNDEKKEIPTHIQNVIDKWKEDHKEDVLEELEEVYLEKYEDYDFNKYLNKIIIFSFPPTGEASDKIRSTVYLYNISVIGEYNRKKSIKENGPNFTSETYIILDKDEIQDIKSIDTLCNNFLLNSYDINMIQIYKKMYSDKNEYLTPFSYNHKFIRKNPNIIDNMYFIELFYKTPNNELKIDVCITYKNGTCKNINNEIYELKYDIVQ